MSAIPTGLLPAFAALAGGLVALAQPPAALVPAKASTPDPQMKAVFDELASLNGKPIETLTPADRSGTTVGCTYTQRLQQAGVPVTGVVYDGVTHEFFGMGAVVD